jgi:transposase-like protein
MGSRTQRSYTEEEQYQAIVKVAEYGGNVSAAAKEMGIPYQTVVVWARKRRHEVIQIHRLLKEEIAENCSSSAVILAEKINEGIEKLSLDGDIVADNKKVLPLENRLKTAVVSLAILIDKMLLLNGKPTNIQDTDVHGTVEKPQPTREELEKAIENNCRILGIDSSRFLGN